MDEKARRLNIAGSWSIEVPLKGPGLSPSEEDTNLALQISRDLGSSLEVIGPDETKVGIFIRTSIATHPTKPIVGVQIFLKEGARLRWVDRLGEEIVEGRFRIDYGDRGPTVVISVAQVATGD